MNNNNISVDERLMGTPFATSFSDYLLNGWHVMPMPLGMKFPPVVGCTGAAGKPLTEEKMWKEMYGYRGDGMKMLNIDDVKTLVPMGNIGLHLPDGVIGIDCDGPEGVEMFRALERKLGALPMVAVLSSHSSLSQGFTLYLRTPKDLKWRSGLGKKVDPQTGKSSGIDVIRKAHRYSVAPPSIHPSGRVYGWFNEYGVKLPNTGDFIPTVEDLPMMPEAWVEHMTIRAGETVKTFRKPGDGAVFAPRDAMAQQRACGLMRHILNKRLNGLELLTGSRHDAMNRAVYDMITSSAEGHRGLSAALDAYRGQWLALFPESERTARTADFARSVRGAEMKVEERAVPCECAGALRAKSRIRATPQTALVGQLGFHELTN